jgi:dTDP-4-dehydrorhamnose 3,5-epimerase
MSKFEIFELPMAGLKQIKREKIEDNRGFLERIFCEKSLLEAGWVKPIAQINHTFTAKHGTVRGMHFQHTPNAEMKLIHCIRGEVWDVAVDIRLGSPTFLNWHAEKLSSINGLAMLIPEGFAHGFQTLTDDVEMLYCHSAPYSVEAEGGLSPIDPLLNISWPLKITELSNRDASHPRITPKFNGLKK